MKQLLQLHKQFPEIKATVINESGQVLLFLGLEHAQIQGYLKKGDYKKEHSINIDGETLYLHLLEDPLQHLSNLLHFLRGCYHLDEEKIFSEFKDIRLQLDLSAKVLYISPNFYRILGSEALHLGERFPGGIIKKGPSVEQLLEKVQQRGKLEAVEVELQTKDGKQVFYELNAVIQNAIAGDYIDLIARDVSNRISERQKLKKAKLIAERSLETKRKFLSNMSHEIRTPLNGVIGMLDLLVDTQLTEEQKDYVTTMRNSSETLLNVVNDILDLSKIEVGKMELKELPIDLRQTFKRCLNMFAYQAENRGIELKLTIDPSVPNVILCDETRLIQILTNLLSNAFKFTQKGCISIYANATRKFGRKFVISIDVKDSGIGISKENQDKLFEQFSQIGTSYEKMHGGTGLGLSIAHELTQMMGGEIGIESAMGEGSTFWFTIEVEDSSEMAAVNLAGDEEFTVSDRFVTLPVLLIVDDNATNLKVASSILEKAGCKVHKTTSPYKAIELARKHRYDLILMDIQMPGMNGMDCARSIRTLNGNTDKPIIAMTAFTMQDEIGTILSNGLDDYLTKPIRSEQLIQKVYEWSDERLIADKSVVKPIEPTPKKEKPSLVPDINELISTEVLMDLRKFGDKEFLMYTYKEFAEECLELLNSMAVDLSKEDYVQFQRDIHTLKGTSQTLGIQHLAKLAVKSEERIRAGDFASVQEDFVRIKKAYHRFKEGYTEIIDKLTGSPQS